VYGWYDMKGQQHLQSDDLSWHIYNKILHYIKRWNICEIKSESHL